MATVWKGEDPLLARAVAVKTLDPILAQDEDLRTRFRREAVAAAAVAHPNIVATYDTGEDDGTAYIVMELVEGATLRQAIDLHGALPPARSADIAAQVADALAAAHARGLVHRDVKPSNVLVQLDGRVKVTDFGIAKAADQPADELTRSGSVMGTARYLAPEQLEGQPVDERADVYSLGLVLYEMLCGHPPFGADTEIATAVARLTAPPPRIADVRPDLAPGLAHVVDRALAREASGRWPNAAAMRDALAPFRVAAPDRTADATMAVALPPRPRAATPSGAALSPIITDDGMGVGGRLLVWFLALALGAGGGYAGFVIATDKNPSSKAPAAPPRNTSLQLVGATAFDPEGTDGENDDDVGLIIDGDTTTAWSTEEYKNATTAPKRGVGFVLDLGRDATVTSVKLDAAQPGWNTQIFVATTTPDTLDGWGARRAEGIDLTTRATIDLSAGPPGRYVLVWLTKLPLDDGVYRVQVSNVTVHGTPA